MVFFKKKNPDPESAWEEHRQKVKARKSHEPKILGINWLGVKTSDIVREAIFMEQVLGLEHANEGNSRIGHHILYDCGPVLLELLEGGVTWANLPKPRLGSPDISLIPTFLVDDIKPVADILFEKELNATQVFDQGWVQSLLFFDPERILWQVANIRNRPYVSTNRLNYLGVLWLEVVDLDRQVAFYRDILELPLVDRGGTIRPVTERRENETPAEAGVDLSLPVNYPEIDLGAVFFKSGTRLAFSPGGVRNGSDKPRIWGKDNPFQIGFSGNNVPELARKLKSLKVPVNGPFNESHPHPWLQFSDPEGNNWRITET